MMCDHPKCRYIRKKQLLRTRQRFATTSVAPMAVNDDPVPTRIFVIDLANAIGRQDGGPNYDPRDLSMDQLSALISKLIWNLRVNGNHDVSLIFCSRNPRQGSFPDADHFALFSTLLDQPSSGLFLASPATVVQIMNSQSFDWDFPIKNDRASDDRLVLQMATKLDELGFLPYIITDDLYIDWSVTGELNRFMPGRQATSVKVICREGIFVPVPQCDLLGILNPPVAVDVVQITDDTDIQMTGC